MMASDKTDLPCWLTPREKYIVNALLTTGFYHHVNYQAESDELCQIEEVYGCKVGLPGGFENSIGVIINGCELRLCLGDSISATEAEMTFKRVKATVRKYYKLWDFDEAINAMNRSK